MENHLYIITAMFSRQEEGQIPPSTTASVNGGDLQPLSRTGSPTSVEKDILVSQNK